MEEFFEGLDLQKGKLSSGGKGQFSCERLLEAVFPRKRVQSYFWSNGWWETSASTSTSVFHLGIHPGTLWFAGQCSTTEPCQPGLESAF